MLLGFLRCRDLGYFKIYDRTNKVYLCANENGLTVRLDSTTESLDNDGMYWTRSLSSIIENKATGKLRWISIRARLANKRNTEGVERQLATGKG